MMFRNKILIIYYNKDCKSYFITTTTTKENDRENNHYQSIIRSKSIREIVFDIKEKTFDCLKIILIIAINEVLIERKQQQQK